MISLSLSLCSFGGRSVLLLMLQPIPWLSVRTSSSVTAECHPWPPMPCRAVQSSLNFQCGYLKELSHMLITVHMTHLPVNLFQHHCPASRKWIVTRWTLQLAGMTVAGSMFTLWHLYTTVQNELWVAFSKIALYWLLQEVLRIAMACDLFLPASWKFVFFLNKNVHNETIFGCSKVS